MLKAIVLLPFFIFGLAAQAVAQPTPQPPSGSAAQLLGVPSRSVQDTNIPTPETINLPAVSRPPTIQSPLGNFDIRSGGIERRQNPSDVFPRNPSEYDSGFKLLYRVNQ